MTDATGLISKNMGDLIEIACPCGHAVSWCFDCYEDDTVFCGFCGRAFTVATEIKVTMLEPQTTAPTQL